MCAEAFCPEHGPYDSKFANCPYCEQGKGSLPTAPRPLEDEETFGGRAHPRAQPISDDDPTILPGAEGYSPDDDDETVLPRRVGGRPDQDADVTLPPLRRQRFLDEPYDDELDMTVLDREDSSLLGWLIVRSSPYMRRGQVLKIKPGAIYGRDPGKSNVVIDDDKVSGIHARVQVKEDQFVLLDLGSANGTWLNGEEITEAKVIVQDDEIRMGETVFVLKTL